ncbi:MAG TPA: hypothetical protein VMU04_00525, partial [Candidatus Acidoferrum sp.]|nr:hypothetical protein [Candidatus Acidoferrum sp.]
MTKQCAVCNGTNYLISADFSAIVATTYTVQAYLKGQLVGQATNQPGVALATCNYALNWRNAAPLPRRGLAELRSGQQPEFLFQEARYGEQPQRGRARSPGCPGSQWADLSRA